ncbi:hypothetical protein BaRGS_00001897 [Batillaria attramentaria]|uniref:Uncharacterized protein n=1 Tax=Batillaria attramentaria TaxID=370345 RepID=A0ABD0M6R2_9CAEN
MASSSWLEDGVGKSAELSVQHELRPAPPVYADGKAGTRTDDLHAPSCGLRHHFPDFRDRFHAGTNARRDFLKGFFAAVWTPQWKRASHTRLVRRF